MNMNLGRGNGNPRAHVASRQWNSEMMAASRDFAGRSPVTLRYAILSAPRSGSTLLARELFRTGVAGDPHEYLNPMAIAAYQAASGATRVTLPEYLGDIESRRTSPNGCFGIKAHYFHLSRLGDTDESRRRIVEEFLRKQDRRILITRRDKLAQAVSYHLAKCSGRWTSEHEKYLGPQPAAAWEFDPVDLGQCLTRMIEDEEGWRRSLAATGLPFIEIVFEDFLASYRETLERVGSYLGIDFGESPLEPALTPTTDARATDLRERFSTYLSHG